MSRFTLAGRTRKIAMTGLLSAVASVLMIAEFPIPFLIPGFVKMDFSEFPALIAAFALGPISGVTVCLIKNLIHLLFTTSGGVGELCNFLLGVCFVLPAGIVYHFRHNRRAALLSSLTGALVMALMSFPLNYFVTYPIYAKFLPVKQIVAMYQALIPGVDGLASCLLLFNVPFTLLKGLLDTLLTFLIYKSISSFIKGQK